MAPRSFIASVERPKDGGGLHRMNCTEHRHYTRDSARRCARRMAEQANARAAQPCTCRSGLTIDECQFGPAVRPLGDEGVAS